VQAIKKGAYSYLTKPFDTPDLLLEIDKALENRRLTTEIRRLKGLLDEKYGGAALCQEREDAWDLEVVSRLPGRNRLSTSTEKAAQERN